MTTNIPPLPKATNPVFSDVFPSNGKPFKYRAYTIKEQKILLTAKETDDPKDMIEAIKTVVAATTGLDVESMPTVDIEYIMLKLRGASVDNMIELQTEDPETKETIKLRFKIDDVEVRRDPNFSNKIKVDDNTAIVMRLPSMKCYTIMSDGSLSKADRLLQVAVNCLDKLVVGDIVYEFDNYTEEQRMAYLEDCTDDVTKAMESFFSGAPKLRRVIKYKRKDGQERSLVIEGINYFFQ